MGNVLYGHGTLGEFDLSSEKVVDFMSDVDVGPLTATYEIGESFGGNVLGTFIGAGLSGRMYEFAKAYFVVWACGKYIDCAVFWKNTRTEV